MSTSKYLFQNRGKIGDYFLAKRKNFPIQVLENLKKKRYFMRHSNVQYSRFMDYFIPAFYSTYQILYRPLI